MFISNRRVKGFNEDEKNTFSLCNSGASKDVVQNRSAWTGAGINPWNYHASNKGWGEELPGNRRRYVPGMELILVDYLRTGDSVGACHCGTTWVVDATTFFSTSLTCSIRFTSSRFGIKQTAGRKKL